MSTFYLTKQISPAFLAESGNEVNFVIFNLIFAPIALIIIYIGISVLIVNYVDTQASLTAVSISNSMSRFQNKLTETDNLSA